MVRSSEARCPDTFSKIAETNKCFLVSNFNLQVQLYEVVIFLLRDSELNTNGMSLMPYFAHGMDR